MLVHVHVSSSLNPVQNIFPIMYHSLDIRFSKQLMSWSIIHHNYFHKSVWNVILKTKEMQICHFPKILCLELFTVFNFWPILVFGLLIEPSFHESMLQNKLFPTIHLFWKQYQANLLSQLKDLGGIAIAGDRRHDSMGHCAKYCAYTVFCCTLPRIIHFALVQV